GKTTGRGAKAAARGTVQATLKRIAASAIRLPTPIRPLSRGASWAPASEARLADANTTPSWAGVTPRRPTKRSANTACPTPPKEFGEGTRQQNRAGAQVGPGDRPALHCLGQQAPVHRTGRRWFGGPDPGGRDSADQERDGVDRYRGSRSKGLHDGPGCARPDQ